MRIGPCASPEIPPTSTAIAALSTPRVFAVIREPPPREMEPTTDSIRGFDVSRRASVHSVPDDRRARRPPRPRPLEPALGPLLRDAARRPRRRRDQGGAPAGRRQRPRRRAPRRRRIGAVHDHQPQQALETPIAWSVYEAAHVFATGPAPAKLGPGHRTNAPYQAFRTADGWINVGGGPQSRWRDVCKVLDAEPLLDDPRFATPALRVQHRKELEALLQPRFLEKPSSVWLEKFEAVGVPAGPILTYDRVFEDPHVRHREMAVEVEHPVAGTTRVLGVPIKLSRTPGAVRRPAPTLGEHTEEVLREVGYDPATIADLRARNVV